MPYPEQHQYMTVIGDAYNATERWQFGMRLSDGGVSNQETALAIADDVEAWWRSNAAPYETGNHFGASNSHRLTELKVARIGVDGQYPDGEVSYSHFYLPPIVGAYVKPTAEVAQTSACVTLTTATPRGLASKGRVFLPSSVRYVTQADGLMTAADAQSIANSVMLLINAVNANAVVGNVMIYSRGKGVPAWDAARRKVTYTYPNPGASHAVTGTSCGRVLDTQRRRRRQLVEARQVDTIA